MTAHAPASPPRHPGVLALTNRRAQGTRRPARRRCKPGSAARRDAVLADAAPARLVHREAVDGHGASNGLSLCKLHHAAFDRHFLTVRPDYMIEVRQSILEEEGGPMLLHGLKDMHDRPIYVPREVTLQPDRARLEERYAACTRSVT